jgi:hypothetical protein
MGRARGSVPLRYNGAQHLGTAETICELSTLQQVDFRLGIINLKPVTREERAQWMGHKDPHHSTTEAWYESFDPDYLLAPMRATDAILAERAGRSWPCACRKTRTQGGEETSELSIDVLRIWPGIGIGLGGKSLRERRW